MERGLLDLTMRWVDRVRSGRMTEILSWILVKLARSMGQGMARVLVVGRGLALTVSVLAVQWGKGQAYAWRFERGFWLGVARAGARLD